MGKIAGIHLGDNFASLAHLSDMGRPEVIPNADGERRMPSAVYFPRDGRVMVGSEALRFRYEDTSRSVRWIQAHMGDSNYRVQMDLNEYSPSEITALIIKKLVQDAVTQIGEITDAVLTIPANFGEVARKATMDAGKIAGLNVVGIVNEPTAAAFYYAITNEIGGRVMIFDLGGSTFDVSVASIIGRDIESVASSGDRALGGFHFDQKLVEYFETAYTAETGEKLYSTPEERAEFEDYAEETKKSLSKKETVKFRLKGEGETVSGEITRAEFESLISSDLARIEMLVETVLDEADVEPSGIQKVLLVGGSSRIPAVQKLLKSMFGYEPTLAGNVDECVSLGAALYAGLRLLEENPSQVSAGQAGALGDIKVGEVCNASYGTTCLSHDDVMERIVLKNDILIKKNSKIPCKVSRTYFTAHPNQEIIEGDVTQGESSDPELVTEISSGKLALPTGLPVNSPIDVTYSYDKDQRMSCVFEHKESRRKLVINLDIGSGTSSFETIEDQQAKLESLIIDEGEENSPTGNRSLARIEDFIVE